MKIMCDSRKRLLVGVLKIWIGLLLELALTGTANGKTAQEVIGNSGAGSLEGPYQAIDPGKVSPGCILAFAKLTADPNKLITVVDAIGKPAAGLLQGNIAWIGHYDECVNTTGYKYCNVQMQLNGTALISEPKLILPVSWGVCTPYECNTSDVTNGIDLLMEIVNVSNFFHPSDVIGASAVCVEDTSEPYDAGFICTVTLCSFIIVIAVLGSLYDAASKVKCQQMNTPLLSLHDTDDVLESYQMNDKDNENTPLLHSTGNLSGKEVTLKEDHKQGLVYKIICCFSLTSNLSKLLDSSQSDRNIKCLNGLRVISMSWVILGHIFVVPMSVKAFDNMPTGLNFAARFGFQAIGNGTFSVDSFFFLSGFLVAYLTLSRMAKTDGKIPWFWFYFHRFWRLTPVYMLTILVVMYISTHFGDGPFWYLYAIQFREPCPKYWWANLLYINNFYPDNIQTGCLAQGWYLANDMQFYVVSPIFLVALFMSPTIGIVLLISALLATFIITAVLIGYYDLSVFMNFTNMAAGIGNQMQGGNFQSIIYSKPYCRIAPYLVGIALGYTMYKIGERKVKMNPVGAALGWSIAAAVAVSTLYGTYPSIEGEYKPSLAANIIYGSLARFAWSVVLAWIVFACKYGYGGWVNDFLSWSGWVVLSRLTYTAYLTHMMVLGTFYFNFGTAAHFSIILYSFYFAGCLTISYGMATIFSLLIEYPFANLEKLFMPIDVQSKRKVAVTSTDKTAHSNHT